MANYPQRGRPGLVFLGFLVAIALLGSTYLALGLGWFDGLGWEFGAYAKLFFFLALGNLLAGLVIRFGFADRPWRAFGTGLLAGGTIGLVVVAVFLFLIVKALSSIPS